MRNFQLQITFVLFAFVLTSGASAFYWDGLSAEEDKANIALLIQGSLPEAKNDIELMKSALTDPIGKYGFSVSTLFNATSTSAYEFIKSGAKKVGPDGTFFIFLAGHGSPDGGSEMNGGGFIRYQQIRTAIKESARHRIRRLVVVIFGCYSGSWINNINQSGDFNPDKGLIEEVLVMTSSASNQLSYFQPGGNSFFVSEFSKSFRALQSQSKTALLKDLLEGVRAGVQSSTVSFKVSPGNLLNERLFN